MFKVLIVDDMDIVRREIKRLKLWGQETDFIISAEAQNGQAALEVLKANPIDLVITDIKMPKVDGMELLKKIVEKNLCSCVVLLSDYTDFNYVRQGLVLGAFDYMTKPVNEQEIEGLLHRARDFIREKNKEIYRVRSLEQKLVEKVEVFFPETDVIQIIELIEDGDQKFFEVMSRMIDITAANLNYDLFKVESVLKSVLLEIEKAIFEKKYWLEKFIDKDSLIDVSFSQCDSIGAMKEVAGNKLRKICTLINVLQCGKRGNDIVSQVSECVLGSLDGEISLKSIAEKLFMNKTYVSEVFKQKTGTSLVHYLTTVKIERAKKLLTDGNYKAYEISGKLGYKDTEYFSKIFKKITGIPPTEFRHNHTYRT